MNDCPPMQPSGDTRASEDMDMSLLDESMDNLTDHLNQLGLNENDVKDAKRNYGKRKVTAEEKNELRSTTLVRKKNKAAGEKEVTFSDFNFLMVIGRGTFGKVFLAEQVANKKLFAVKSIRKDILI